MRIPRVAFRLERRVKKEAELFGHLFFCYFQCFNHSQNSNLTDLNTFVKNNILAYDFSLTPGETKGIAAGTGGGLLIVTITGNNCEVLKMYGWYYRNQYAKYLTGTPFDSYSYNQGDGVTITAVNNGYNVKNTSAANRTIHLRFIRALL